MSDVEPLILDQLHRLSPLEEIGGDWQAVVAHAAPHRRRRRAAVAALTFALALAVVVPTLALSATLRNLVGLGEPQPNYNDARLRLQVSLGEGYIARLWTAPSTQGGECEFTTYDPVNAPAKPKRITGGGFCSLPGSHLLPKKQLYWSLGSSLGDSFVLTGAAGPDLHVSHVTLRWHGGSQTIATRDGYFLGAVAIVKNPPFKLLPFDLVAGNQTGRVVKEDRIPTSVLYWNWKQVEPKLTAYRQAHGCSKTPPIWHCRSR